MAVRTWVGQFGIVQGQALEAGPWQGKFGFYSSGEDPVDLYVLVQPALPGSEEFCGQLVAVVGHLFERLDLSLTGALTKVISAAHENLRDWNRRSLREHQVGAGLSCLVVRGPLAYLAQAGPSLAYYRHGAAFMRVAPDDSRATAVLGLGEELRPQLRRYELAPGDLLLVASPSLDEVVDESQLSALLTKDAEQILSELYLIARDQPNFSVFLLSCFEEVDLSETPATTDLSAESVSVPEAVVPSQADGGFAMESLEQPQMPVEAPPAAEEAEPPEPEPEPEAAEPASQELAPVEPAQQSLLDWILPPEVREKPVDMPSYAPPAAEEAEPPEPEPEPEAAEPAPQEFAPVEPVEQSLLDWILPPEVREKPVDMPSYAPPAPAVEKDDYVEDVRSTLGLLELEAVPATAPVPELRDIMRLRGKQPSARHGTPNPVAKVGERVPFWVLPVILLVALAALFAWWAVPQSMEGNRTEKFDSLLATAKSDYSAALSTTDQSEKRRLLDAANSQIAQADDIRSDDSELQGLADNIAAALAQMNGVRELTNLHPIADLKTQLTGDLSLEQLLVGGNAALLLDSKEGRVVSLPLIGYGGQAQEVLRQGDKVDATEVGNPVQIAWLPDINGGSLLVIDSERHLFALNSDNGPTQLGLEGSDAWQSLDGVFANADGLYVLDGKSGKLWLYPSQEGSLATAPEQVLSDGNLVGTVDVAVNGDIYVLTSSGDILRFSAGQQVPFDMEGIDRPLTSPASLVPLSDGDLMVVDRGNKRLVLLSPDGRFEGQYVSSQLMDPQAIAVDEVAAQLFILNGDTVFVADLPSGNPPPAATPTVDAAP